MNEAHGVSLPGEPPMPWTLTGFADQAGPELGDQIALFGDLGLRWLDLRSAWGPTSSPSTTIRSRKPKGSSTPPGSRSRRSRR